MADAANDGLSYPATFNEFLALMERWHRARDGAPNQGEHPLEALRRTAHELTDVTAMARQVWTNAEAGRTAGAPANRAACEVERDAAKCWREPCAAAGACTAPIAGVPACPALPTNADMDRIYDAVLRQFAERLIIQPDEVEVDPKKHPSFYRALMHSAWLAGATADGVGGNDASR